MSLYDIGLWITQLQLWGERLNILGLAWLVVLTLYTYKQIRLPINQIRAEKGWKQLASWRLILVALMPVALCHFTHDEIDTFLYLAFGHILVSWLSSKLGVYTAIAFVFLLAVLFDVPSRFKFTWKTLIISLALFSFSCYFVGINVGDFVEYQGWERVWRFWLTYPLSKTLLGLAYASALIKQPRAQDTRGEELNQRLYQKILARIINRGRHSHMELIASSRRFGLNIGCGKTRYENKINVDVERKVDVDIVADARYLPFRPGCCEEIFMDQVLEHIPQDLKVVQEVQRVLQAPGWFICSVPRTGILARVDKFLLHPHEYHASYTQARLGDLLGSCGFRILGSWVYGTLPHYSHLWAMPAASLFMIGRKP